MVSFRTTGLLTTNKGKPGSNSPVSTTTSLTDVETGYYTTITPTGSGQILVLCAMEGFSDTAGDGVLFGIYTATAKPTGGNAATGTKQTNTGILTSGTLNAQYTVTIALLLTLNLGTLYYVKLAFAATGGGTAHLTGIENQNPIAIEV